MTYWRRRGIPEDPGYFPFGSQATWDLFSRKIAFSEITNSPYKRFPDAKLVGSYGALGTPLLMIRDPELAKSVLVHFIARYGRALWRAGSRKVCARFAQDFAQA